VYRVVRADGAVRWVSIDGRRIYRDTPNGSRPVRSIGTVIDITHLKESERALSEKNNQLELLKDIATTANQASTIAEAMQFAVDRVCEFTGWPLGHAYIASSGQKHLVSSPIWSGLQGGRFDAFRAASEASGFSIEADLLGKVIADERPIWVNDVANDPSFTRRSVARQTGIRSAFAFPVLGGGEVIALLEIASVMQKNAEDAKLEQSFGKGKVTVGGLPCMQQSSHAEGALERMLEVVIARVDRLVIGIVPAETFDGEGENPRDEERITLGKHCKVRGLGVRFDCGRVVRGHRQNHLVKEYTG